MATQITRPDWNLQLSPIHLAFVQHVDAKRTIGEIANLVAKSGFRRPTTVRTLEVARRLFDAQALRFHRNRTPTHRVANGRGVRA